MRIASPVALAAVRAASSVAAVVPDRIVAAQQEPVKPACAAPRQLSQGLVPVLVARTFVWQGCNNAANGRLRCAFAPACHVQFGACTTTATAVAAALYSSCLFIVVCCGTTHDSIGLLTCCRFTVLLRSCCPAPYAAQP
jgi:hypothetical protein